METVSPTPATARQYEAEHRQSADQPRRSLAGQRGPVHGRPARRQRRGVVPWARPKDLTR